MTLSVDGAICVGNDDNKCFVQPKLHALMNEKLSGQVDKMLNFVFFYFFENYYFPLFDQSAKHIFHIPLLKSAIMIRNFNRLLSIVAVCY